MGILLLNEDEKKIGNIGSKGPIIPRLLAMH